MNPRNYLVYLIPFAIPSTVCMKFINLVYYLRVYACISLRAGWGNSLYTSESEYRDVSEILQQGGGRDPEWESWNHEACGVHICPYFLLWLLANRGACHCSHFSWNRVKRSKSGISKWCFLIGEEIHMLLMWSSLWREERPSITGSLSEAPFFLVIFIFLESVFFLHRPTFYNSSIVYVFVSCAYLLVNLPLIDMPSEQNSYLSYP